ncbi:MAG: hypothetical protein HGA85_01955 [Nanoarchaeota archaeon]|nr:hypothetical protein [Nanoarchaeota archaeon]
MNFEGLFSMKEVFRVVDKYFRTKGFDKKIIFDEEYNTEKGKYIHVKAEYYKKTDAYVRLQVRLWIYANDLIEVEKEVEGVKVKTNHGKFNIIFDGQLQTGYITDNFNDTKPLYFFWRVIYEQYIARPRIAYWENVIRHVITELKTEVAGYLNINKLMYER